MPQARFRSVKQEVQATLDMRRSLATWMDSANGHRWMQAEVDASRILGREVASTKSGLTVLWGEMADATPYFVEEEMLQVAVAASSHSTFPGYSFDPGEMPSPTGMILLPRAVEFVIHEVGNVLLGGAEKPHTEIIHVEGFFWAVIPGERAADGDPRFVSWCLQSSPEMDRINEVYSFYPPRLMPSGYTVIHFGAQKWTNDDDHPEEEMRLLKTLWLLMGQQLSETKKVPGAKHEQEKAKRKGRAVPEVTVVTLRRMQSTEEYQGEHRDREYSHRFIVGGHWRNYKDERYSERLRSVPQWISPYVKGDPEKPLVVKQKVYRLAR